MARRRSRCQHHWQLEPSGSARGVRAPGAATVGVCAKCNRRRRFDAYRELTGDARVESIQAAAQAAGISAATFAWAIQRHERMPRPGAGGQS